jgi:DNA-binding NarL/FixJ family response regulator
VVVLSSSTLDEDLEKAQKLGAREYLVKPHGIHSLVGMLQQVHNRYFGMK